MAAHRYWKLTENTTGNGWGSCAKLQLRDSYGGADRCGSGTPSSSSAHGSYPLSNAFDSNASTFWLSSSGTAPHWISYDFGSGASYDIIEVAFTIRNDGFGVAEAPSDLTLSYSDDGTTWTAQKSNFGTGLSWTNGETKTYNTAVLPAGTVVATVTFLEVMAYYSPLPDARATSVFLEVMASAAPAAHPFAYAFTIE